MYLQKLFVHSKKLFFLFTIFCLLQLFFTYKGIETFPFFNFGMYSEKKPPIEIYEGVIIKTDGKIFNYSSLPSLNKEMLIEPLVRYSELKKKHFIDEPLLSAVEKRFKTRISNENYEYCLGHLTNSVKDTIAFQQWFKNYLEFSTNQSFKNIEVYAGNYYYDTSSRLQLKDSLLLFKLRWR